MKIEPVCQVKPHGFEPMHFTKWAAFLPLLCITQCTPDIYVEGEQMYLNGVGDTITTFGQLRETILKQNRGPVAAGNELVVYANSRIPQGTNLCMTPLDGFQDDQELVNYRDCDMHFSFVSRPFWHILNGKVTAFLSSEVIVYDHLQIFADLKAVSFSLAHSEFIRPNDLLAYGSETPSDDTLIQELHGKYFVIVDRPYLKIEASRLRFYLETEDSSNFALISNFGQLTTSQNMELSALTQIPHKLHYVGPGSPKEETPLKQLNGKYFSIQRFAFDSVEVVDCNGFFPEISFKLSFVGERCKLQHFLELSNQATGFLGNETFDLGKNDLIQSQEIFIPEMNENDYFIVKLNTDEKNLETVVFSPSEILEEQKISKEPYGEDSHAPIARCQDGYIQSFLFKEGEYYKKMVSFYAREQISIGILDLYEFPAKDIILALMFQSSCDFFDVSGSKEDRISSLISAFLFAHYFMLEAAMSRISNALEKFIVEPRLFTVYALILIRENAINLISDSLHLVPIKDLWLNLFDIKIMKQDFIFEYVEFLIEQGINVNYPNRNNETLIRFAGLADNMQVVQLLLANGAHLDSYPLKLKYKLLKSSQ